MNIRKILPVFLLFLGVCIHATAYSQEINIQGYVHARGMSNHANIVVVFTSPTERYSATTDASGHYSIQIAIAKYVITCTRDGFFDHYENEIYLSSSQIYPEMTLIPISTRLHVPADFSSIQSALNSARQADTVLVSPGQYHENIHFNGVNIVVGSLYLTTGDTTYISQTVIDGDSKGRAVRFSDGEDSTTVFCGFTIKNGKFPNSASDNMGAAILCSDSSPILKNLVIVDNQGSNGGVVAFVHSDARFMDSRLENNISSYGGMIYLEDTRASLSNILVRSGFSYDCGIYISRGKPVIRNMVVNNLTSVSSYVKSFNVMYSVESDAEVKNCIISENDGYGFYIESGNPSVSHSAFWNNKRGSIGITDGITSIGRNITVNANNDSCDAYGNIQCDPQFVDSGKGDYHLKNTSPCIGTGVSADFPLADIYGVIRGTPPDMGVIENPLNSPLAFVQIVSPNGGEIWTSGSLHAISWTSSKVSRIGLEYSPDGGSTWNSIVSGISASTRIYNWTVTGAVSEQYMVRITSNSDETISDASNAHFTVIRGGLADSPWPMFRQNLLHTGLGTGSAPASDMLKWKFQISGVTYSSPTVGSDGTLFFGSDDKNLYAVNPDGTLKWKYPTTGMVQSSPALASDGTVYVSSYDKCLYAIRPDGSLRWKFTTGGILFSSPAVDSEGTIYFGSQDGFLYAAYPDGTLKWKLEAGSLNSSPAMGPNGIIYVGSKDNNLYAINPDGAINWKYLTGGAIDSSPVILNDDTIIVRSGDDFLYAIKPSGTLRWKMSMKTSQYLSPAVTREGTIYIGSDDACLYALQPGGTEKWKYNSGNPIISSPTIGADGAIYFSNTTSVQSLNPDGTLRWKYGIGNGNYSFASPVIDANGTLYAISGNYNLCAFTPSTVTLSVPNGGEEWSAGTKQIISWTSTGATLIKLEYSLDNGNTWNTIASQIDASKVHSYIWTTPISMSSTCRIRVSNPSIPSVVDQSGTFTILSQTLTLTAPNGGEKWCAQNAYTVTWNGIGISRVKIEYSTDNGSTWSAVADSLASADQAYSWKIPNDSSSRCRVRISDCWNPSCFDISDASFSIAPQPLLRVISPNGGEDLQGGNTQDISWTASGIDSVRIEYSPNNGSSWITIADRVAAVQGAFSWKIPEKSSSTYLIRITDTADALIFDTSDATFAIHKYNLNAGFILDADIETAGCQETGSIENPGRDSLVGFALYAKDWGNAKGFTVTFSWDPGKLAFRTASSSPDIASEDITINGETIIPAEEHNILGNQLLGLEEHLSGLYKKSFVKQGGEAINAQSGLIFFAVFRTMSSFSTSDTLAIRTSVSMADAEGVESMLGVRFFTIRASLLPPSNLTVSDIPNDQGHSLKLSWTASSSENSGIVSGYRICRSRSNTYIDPPIPLSSFTSLDSLITAEERNTILIDTVAAGTTEYIDSSVPLSGVPYTYWIQAVGGVGVSKPVASGVRTCAEEIASLPKSLHLGEAYPNPFNPSTNIDYSIPQNGRVALQVYNISGQRVATLVEGTVSAGKHTVVWDARNMPSGMYFYTLRAANGYQVTKKVLLLK